MKYQSLVFDVLAFPTLHGVVPPCHVGHADVVQHM